MIARIFLLVLVAMFLVNRLLNSRESQKSNRAYQKESRYYVIMGLAFATIAVIIIYVIQPSALGFAQLKPPTFLYGIGNLFLLAGIVVWIWSKQALGNNWSPRIAIHHRHTLITTGPYRLVRHPIYASYVIDVVGIILATGNLAVTLPCAVIAALTWSRISAEEKVLRDKFGVNYEKYARTTGRLFPKIL